VPLLSLVKTSSRASPRSAGDSVMLQEIEKVSRAPLDYIDANNTGAMKRFLELMTMPSGRWRKPSTRMNFSNGVRDG
jgi:hypothetical protein